MMESGRFEDLQKGASEYMEIRIIQLGNEPAVVKAAKELSHYLPKIDPSVETAILIGTEQLKGIRVGLLKDETSDYFCPLSRFDDAFVIETSGGEGYITGANPRSVLIAAYRFLRAAGCRWVRPGEDGEKIIPGNVRSLRVSVREKASYRHRGVCVEGDCSFSHVLRMIDWMPKLGLNGYFHQFFIPYTFFEKWYRHPTNPQMKPEPLCEDDVSAFVESSVAAIKERGMLFHQVGHGWTCEPFGISGKGWEPKEYHLTEEQAAPFALVNGKRDIWQGIGLNTNLCYSNPVVKKTLVNTIVTYAKTHPQVDYLHFWLADDACNHCECAGCKDTMPSDFYVQILNEADKRLTEEKLDTRIVFLIYLDLLWVPEKERIIHEDRFVLMFAPISRTYSKTFLEAAQQGEGAVKPYIRNKNSMPTKVEDNIAYLRQWQKQYGGDSFVYDYHLLWDANFDMWGYHSSEILFQDMKNLAHFGLNGMVSCQVQRAAFPTALGMVGMACALWDKEKTFDATAEEYFIDLFGTKDAEMMKHYFQKVSSLLHSPYLRLEEEIISPERAGKYRQLYDFIDGKKSLFLKKKDNADNLCDRTTWKLVCIHAEVCMLLARVLERKADGKQEEALKLWEQVVIRANQLEASDPDVRNSWDVGFFLNTVGGAVRGEKRPGIDY